MLNLKKNKRKTEDEIYFGNLFELKQDQHCAVDLFGFVQKSIKECKKKTKIKWRNKKQEGKVSVCWPVSISQFSIGSNFMPLARNIKSHLSTLYVGRLIIIARLWHSLLAPLHKKLAPGIIFRQINNRPFILNIL